MEFYYQLSSRYQLVKHMKNKRLQTVSLAFLFLLLASPASANLGELLGNRRDKMENRQEEIKESIEERQETRQSRRTDIAGKHAERLEQRFSNYYTRLNFIIGKIQSQIDLATTKDTSQAQSKLTEAKTTLAEAKTLGESAVSQFKAIDPDKWNIQKPKAEVARDTANKAREAFKKTLVLMSESLRLLKLAPAK